MPTDEEILKDVQQRAWRAMGSYEMRTARSMPREYTKVLITLEVFHALERAVRRQDQVMVFIDAARQPDAVSHKAQLAVTGSTLFGFDLEVDESLPPNGIVFRTDVVA